MQALFSPMRRWVLKCKSLLIFALGIGVCIFSSSALAHHGSAEYDTDKRVTIKGTVTQWLWSNPHCILQLDVTDASNQVVHWYAETENPSTISHFGLSRTSFKPGDEVTVTMITVKNGRPLGRIAEVVLPDGRKVKGIIPGPRGVESEETPK
jgi:hypothetical protein